MTRLEQVQERYDTGDGGPSSVMAAYSLDAVDHATTFGVKLDFSDKSVKDVEHVLDQLYLQRPRGIRKLFGGDFSEEKIDTLSTMYGAYVGEVMRFEWGATDWELPDDGPFEGVYTINYNGLQTSPPAKVCKRLMEGQDDDVWAYYRILTDERDGDLLS